MGRLAGALIGAIPGLVLWVVGFLVTGGFDGMIPFAFGGIVLTLVGPVAGVAWGSKAESWPGRNSTTGAVAGSAGVLLLAAALLALGGAPPSDPTLNARDCHEVFELLGAIGPQGELLDLPSLSEEQINNVRLIVEQDPADEFCIELRTEAL